MLTNIAVQNMFESVARSQPALREWLSAEYERNVNLLVNHAGDADQLRRLQGHAQCLSGLIKNLDQAVAQKAKPVPPAAKRAF